MSWFEKPTILTRITPLFDYVFFDESGTITDLKATRKKSYKKRKH